ncbi:NAD-dependent epimerase/dehydratase family protein [Formosa sediminum]|uniref:NAD-dependent epimerase/dehydratase family protein n=1 Tax=Formosa sediminum TaxID=2594004 RepID=A0A516GS24_9FLAO|nr:NAD-dependent epimerase/dehydratase family protein [Formosa sediminum]QDO94170.1 NAD-dependent epimerase/dehydratase family protein [Formosa sediminum]
MNTILITGGAGNIGSSLVAALATEPDTQLVVVDNLLTGVESHIPKLSNVKFIQADVNRYNDVAPVFERFNINYVFHLAAMVGVKRTLANPLRVLQDIEGIKNILSLSKASDVRRVFYSSSSEVYGEPFEVPQHENTTPLNSRLPYAIVKNVGESFFKSYQQEFGLDYTIFRFFNTYGPHQSDDFVVPRFLHAAQTNKPITIHGNGQQTRSFCYIDDTVSTCVEAYKKQLFINDVLNVGNDNEMTILELANRIIAFTNSKSEIIHLPALVEGDMKRRCPNNKRMKQVLERELVSLENGLKLMS